MNKYVLGKTLDGLFLVLGEEVKKICKDPATQTTSLLKEVFGRKYLRSSRRVWPRLHKTSMVPNRSPARSVRAGAARQNGRWRR